MPVVHGAVIVVVTVTSIVVAIMVGSVICEDVESVEVLVVSVPRVFPEPVSRAAVLVPVIASSPAVLVPVISAAGLVPVIASSSAVLVPVIRASPALLVVVEVAEMLDVNKVSKDVAIRVVEIAVDVKVFVSIATTSRQPMVPIISFTMLLESSAPPLIIALLHIDGRPAQCLSWLVN